MVSEDMSARQETSRPVDHPVLAGEGAHPAQGQRPLHDGAGQPLMPRVVHALRAGLTLPQPEAVVRERARRELQPGAVTDPFDPAWIPTAMQRGWTIRGEQLGRLLRRIAGPAARTVRVWAHRARARRDLRGVLELYGSIGGPAPWTDLGGSRGQILAEARKPFWRA